MSGIQRTHGPTTSFEIGASVFNTAGSLRELISAASSDNVQPQALLAAEQLGARFLICPERINEAIDALGGNQSVRLDYLKVTIGLSSGGVRKAVRESSSLLSLFAICAASKLCYLDDEIGLLLFEMAKVVGILNTFPVSSSQFSMFVKQLSGHCESIVPITLMHEIALRVDEESTGPTIFSRINMKELSSLLCEFFQFFRDDEVTEVALEGHYHAVWLATLLVWLIGEDNICVYIDNIHIRGSREAKAKIHIMSHFKDSWKLTIWRTSVSPKDYIYSCDDEYEEPLNHVPITFTRMWFRFHHWGGLEPQIQEEVERLTQLLVTALVLLVCDKGGLRIREADPHKRVRFDSIISRKWLYSSSQIALRYGWEHTTDEMQYKARKLSKLFAENLQDQAAEGFRDFIEIQMRSFQQDHAEGILFKKYSSYVHWPAVHLAVHALITSTCTFPDDQQYIGVNDFQNGPKAESLYLEILYRTMDLNSFRATALARALPRFRDKDDGNLLVSRDGYTAAVGALWDCSTQQRDAMLIKVCRGNIRKDGVVYDRVTEGGACYGSVMPSTYYFNEQISELSVNSDASVKLPLLKGVPKLVTLASETASILQVKQYIRSYDESGIPLKRWVFWISAVNALVGATHVDRNSDVFLEQNSLNVQDLDWSLSNPKLWGVTPYTILSDHAQPRIIVATDGDKMLRYFVAGLFWNYPHVIMRHEASLAQCIAKAGKLGDKWVIID